MGFGCPPLPPSLYIDGGGAWGQPTLHPCPLPLPTPLTFHRYALGEALPEFRYHHHHHTVVLVQISSTSSLSLAGSRRRGRRRAARVLNSKVPSVWHLIGSSWTDRDWIAKTFDYINRVLEPLLLSDLQGYVDATSLSLS